MSLLYKAAGFITNRKMKMIQRPEVYYVNINITTDGFEFIGAYAAFPNLSKNSAGFSLDIPWSNIKDIKKTKSRVMHTITIETFDTFYTILPLDPDNTSTFNPMSSSKRNALELFDTINRAKAQIKDSTGSTESKSILCSECGVEIPENSKFCGNCGHKAS